MTENHAQPPQTPLESEAQASLRADILRQISAAHGELTKVLAQLGSGDAGRMQIALQLTNLSALRQQAGGATEAMLQQMQAEIATTLANAQSLASGGTEVAGNGASATLAKASAKARQTAQGFLSDYYDKHEFDKYLEFQSEQDERAFREREAARQREIQEALAANTPEGNARALQLEKAQLLDAKKYGADRSPEFQGQEDKLNAEAARLESAMTANRPKIDTTTAIVANTGNPAISKSVDVGIAETLKQAGVVIADQSQTGHGVKVDASIAALLARG